MRREDLEYALNALDEQTVDEALRAACEKSAEQREVKRNSGKKSYTKPVVIAAAAALTIAVVAAIAILLGVMMSGKPEPETVLPPHSGSVGQTSETITTSSSPTAQAKTSEPAGSTESTGTTKTPEGDGATVEYQGMVFRRRADQKSYALVGTTEDLESITVPDEVNGLPVTEVCAVFDVGSDGTWTMTLSKNISSVDSANFRCSAGALMIVVDEENQNFKMESGCLIDRRTNCLLRANKEFTMPGAGVEAIGENAFYGHNELQSFAVPEGVAAIGASAFEGCVLLREIALPSTLTALGKDAFRNCPRLERANFASVDSYNAIAFENIHSDPAALCGAFYADGAPVKPETGEPDGTADIQAWANWMYTQRLAGFAHPLLCAGYPANKDKTSGCAWEYQPGGFFFNYILGTDSLPFSEDLAGYTWEIFYREKGSETFASIVTAPASFEFIKYYSFDEQWIMFRLPTYEKGMDDISSKDGINTYEFLFIICENGENGEKSKIAGWYKDEIIVTPAYEKYLSDALDDNAFDMHEHSIALIEVRNPTCTEMGFTRKVFCRTCGKVLEKSQLMRPLGHNYVDGICTRCGDRELRIEKLDDLFDLRLRADRTEMIISEGEPGMLLHKGAHDPSPFEYNRRYRIKDRYDQSRETIWLRVILDNSLIDLSKFDQKYLADGTIENLWVVFINEEGQTYQLYPSVDQIVVEKLGDEKMLLRVAIIDPDRSGVPLASEEGRGQRWQAHLLFYHCVYPNGFPSGTGSYEAYDLALSISFDLTDSFDQVCFDYASKAEFFYYKSQFDSFHTEHKFVTETTADCLNGGVEKIICAQCRLCLEEKNVQALGHSYRNGKCTRCGGCENHTYVIEEEIPATCTEMGRSEGRSCSVCGQVFASALPTPRLYHDFADGVCTRCGKERIEFDENIVYRLGEEPELQLTDYIILGGYETIWSISSCFQIQFAIPSQELAYSVRAKRNDEYIYSCCFYRESGTEEYRFVDFEQNYTFLYYDATERAFIGFRTYRAGMTDLEEGKQYDLVFVIWTEKLGLVQWIDLKDVKITEYYTSQLNTAIEKGRT